MWHNGCISTTKYIFNAGFVTTMDIYLRLLSCYRLILGTVATAIDGLQIIFFDILHSWYSFYCRSS